MPKLMNMRNMYFSELDLQLFAGDDDAGDDSGDGDDQDDDSRDDDADEDGEDEPKYTQADLDKAVARTIAKERAKAERAAKRKEQKKNEGDSGAEENEDVKARKKAEARAIKAETRAACFEAGVSKDAIDDVTALAHSYMAADENLDLEDAIEKVVKKYPQFKKDAADPYEDDDETKGKSWGQRQNGKTPKKMSGVEKKFYELNPDLKK